MARRGDVKQVVSGVGLLGHRLLNDIAGAVSAELLERAHMEMPGPSGKSERSGTIKMNLMFVGPLSDRDRDAARVVMGGLKKKAQLLLLLAKHRG